MQQLSMLGSNGALANEIPPTARRFDSEQFGSRALIRTLAVSAAALAAGGAHFCTGTSNARSYFVVGQSIGKPATARSMRIADRESPGVVSGPDQTVGWPADAAELGEVVRFVFPSSVLSLTTQTDPDEGWSRVVVNVLTGIADIEQRSAFEDEFYEITDGSLRFRAALERTVVSFS